jgi:Flp pilus assembly protein TadG
MPRSAHDSPTLWNAARRRSRRLPRQRIASLWYNPCFIGNVTTVMSESRSQRRQHGIATVETALCSLVFFLALLPMFDLSRALYRTASIHHATRAATRYATTGATLENPGQTGQNLSREDSIKQLVKSYTGLDMDSAYISVSSMTVGGVAGVGAGGPGDFVTVSVVHDVELATPLVQALFPDGKYRVQVSATFLNENFQPQGS